MAKSMGSQKRPSKRMMSLRGGKSRVRGKVAGQKYPSAGSTAGQMSHMKDC